MTGFPELRFTLPDGREVETVARDGHHVRRDEGGPPVTVLYDPADPRAGAMDGPSASAGATIAGVGVPRHRRGRWSCSAAG